MIDKIKQEDITDTNTSTIPNLGDVIQSSDVSQKGGGSYKADYVNWCRTSHLLHEHAPGWQFHLSKPSNSDCHVFKAPDNTAYVVGYFTGPNGEITPEFPQAIMDNRNKAIQFDNVSARDLTDSHRRCLCTAAAAQFGLAWQLWAREEIENPHRESKVVQMPEPSSNNYSKLKQQIEAYKKRIADCESYEKLQEIYAEYNEQGDELRKHLRSTMLARRDKLKPKGDTE